MISSPLLAFPGGPPAGTSGAPGEQTCNDCHGDFPLNSGNGSVVITAFPDLFTLGYIPSANYTVNVTVDKWGQKRWGFEMTALRDSNDSKAGEFTLIQPGRTRIDNAGNGRQYVTHCCADDPGTGGVGDAGAGTPGPFSWSVQWTAPANGTGAVSFYAAGNTANNDNTPSGDWIYTTSRTAPEDTVAPSVSLASPPANSTLRGTVPVAANATDLNGIAMVEFLLDGTVSLVDSAPPFRWDWDTNTSFDGAHTLSARASDGAMNNRTASIQVLVQNDWTPPNVRILSPAEGATVNSTVRVLANASDDFGLAKVSFFLDGALQQENNSGGPTFTWDWDTATAFNGPHTVLVRAEDGAGQAARSTVNVSVKNAVNDTVPPRVSFVSPSAGSVVSGDAPVELDASDDKKLVLVELRIDQVVEMKFTSPPFEFSWATKNFSSGPHVLNATAFDQAGNRNWSEIGVTVDNDVTLPIVMIVRPANGARVAGVAKVEASATDAKGAVEFDLLLDGEVIATASGAGPHVWDWDTKIAMNGPRHLEVAARDAAGNEGRAGIEAVVVNLPAPVILTFRTTGTAGRIIANGTADPLALSVEVRANQGAWKNASGVAWWSIEIDISDIAADYILVQARAWSGVGHSPVASLGFEIDPSLKPAPDRLAGGLALAVGAVTMFVVALPVALLLRRRAAGRKKRRSRPK
jgi:hypothetical protein